MTMGDLDISGHPDTRALLEGFNLALKNDDLPTTFHVLDWFHTVSDARKFVGWVCSPQVKSVDDIIAHIRVREAPHQAPHPDNKEIMDLFHQHVVAYLRGVGHPDDQYVRDVVGANVFDAGKGDPLLRVNALLKTARASDILPTSPVWYIDFFISHEWDSDLYPIELPNGDIEWGPEQPITFRSCFSAANVTNNTHLRMLLTVDESTSTGDTIFGRWLHLQVFASQGFNRA
ncbi:hypothetical protein PILCRDRAFT_546267 [Piloderma croceum F 1598]|uniref:Uncharacterized protein n=1 Tax=Piloderma croceum (strain F 1598) TaxID=765440 RepID=A0A0C3F537_PILCF|nr:hypothetical protein PILCRDRAFT_546267 [Piloderma croceum F 1598]